MPEQPEVNDVWASQTLTENLTLPSGQTCVAKRVDLTEILKQGLGEQMDTLTAYVMEKHVGRVRGRTPQDRKAKGESKKEIDVTSLSDEDFDKFMRDNPGALSASIFVMDQVLPLAVVKPVVLLHFRMGEDGKPESIPAAQRKPGGIYTDTIGLEDKAFIFQWAVGGFPDARFRGRPADAVGDVDDGESLPVPAVRTGGSRSRRRKR